MAPYRRLCLGRSGASVHAERHGFVSYRRSAEHGFTLIELMVVITVIGLASAIAVMAMPDPRGRLLDEAATFAARTRAAHDAAIIDARPMSVWVSTTGYGFDERNRGQWRAISEKPLRVATWGAGVRPTLSAERDRVIFDSTGLADRPLDLRLTRDGESTIVRVGMDGSVRVGG